MKTHFIKVRTKGEKRFYFMSSKGTNRLRFHALRFTKEEAEAEVAELAPLNPELEFRVQQI